jgi:ABC-2 type transport system ATP-binding protein
MASGTPDELIRQEGARNLEDVFIKYVEKSTNQKIETSFEELKSIVSREVEK